MLFWPVSCTLNSVSVSIKPDQDDQRNARPVTGGAYIKTRLPAKLQARTAGRMGALFAGAAPTLYIPGFLSFFDHKIDPVPYGRWAKKPSPTLTHEKQERTNVSYLII